MTGLSRFLWGFVGTCRGCGVSVSEIPDSVSVPFVDSEQLFSLFRRYSDVFVVSYFFLESWSPRWSIFSQIVVSRPRRHDVGGGEEFHKSLDELRLHLVVCVAQCSGRGSVLVHLFCEGENRKVIRCECGRVSESSAIVIV